MTRRALPIAAGVLCVFACAATGAQASGAGTASVNAQTRYVRLGRACPPPKGRRLECFAEKLIPATSKTVGAVPFSAFNSGGGDGPNGGFSPAQLASAYEYNPTEGGAGQTIALIDEHNDPNIESDLETFDKNYGIAACTTANGCFKKVSETGSTSSLPANDTSGWSVELTLDVETAHAVCQRCKILLVETKNYEELGPGAEEAVKLGATEVSNSYGGAEGEYSESLYDHPGVVITVSTGDNGWYEWDFFNKRKSSGEHNVQEKPNYPSSLPTVVAVGGTSLYLNENGTRKSESVWNNNGLADANGAAKKSAAGASGGGCSTIFTAPLWQQNVIGWSATGCGDKRLNADIAAVGNPNTGFSIYDSYNCGETCEKEGGGGGWEVWGGTSLSSPIIAAMYGIAGGAGGVSYPAATLYSHFGQSGAFFDVTEGGNGYCDAAPEATCGKPNVTYGEKLDCEGTTACDAAVGFDGPTGVGTPKGLAGFRPDDFTAVTQTSATLQARVNPDGSNVTECKFEYGTSESYGSAVACKALPGSGKVPVLVMQSVAGLAPSTRYHFRVVTDNGKGTLAGPDVVLTTPAATAPSAETKGAVAVEETSAELLATIDPRGAGTSCTFEYGTTTSYGSSAPCAFSPGSEAEPIEDYATVKLAAGTTYHYRISATNGKGTTKGGDRTLKTT